MRYFTAGESHGPRLTAILEGVPSGLMLDAAIINVELKRRQSGYGRGERMKIEDDQIEITSGVRHGRTIGSPITLSVRNRDFEQWKKIMAVEDVNDEIKRQRRLTKPRPGHADLVGGMKYEFEDLRNVLERSSARETTMRVAVGAVAKQVLTQLDIEIANHIVCFGEYDIQSSTTLTVDEIKSLAGQNDLSIVDMTQVNKIHAYIDQVKKDGDTIGGIVEVRAENVPAGLGSYVQFDRKLDAKIASAIVSINAFKGVEFGIGFEGGKKRGSQVMDEIIWNEVEGYRRRTNNLGGFEGGMTNGEQIIVRGIMKPIPTLYNPLMSVDIETHKAYEASVERSDPTALPAAGVIMENVIATILAQEICEKFSCDTMYDLEKAVLSYRKRIKNY